MEEPLVAARHAERDRPVAMMTASHIRIGMVAVVAALIGTVAAVGVAEAACRLIMPHWKEFLSERFMAARIVPGYMTIISGRPGFDDYFSQNNGDFRVRVTINAEGHRSPKPAVASGENLWALGDSFTFGWGVDASRRFSDIAGQVAGVPVYNLASPGADVCAYRAQRASMPSQTVPRAVVVGLTLENDIADYDCGALFLKNSQAEVAPNGWHLSLSDIKQLLMGHSALYNFAAVSLKRVAGIDEWLKRVGLVSREHAYRRDFDPMEIPRRAERTASELIDLRGSFSPSIPFAVMIVPGRFEILTNDPFYAELRRSVVRELAARGIDVVDPYDGLVSAGFAATHFAHDGHWSDEGHRIAGEALADWLKRRLAG